MLKTTVLQIATSVVTVFTVLAYAALAALVTLKLIYQVRRYLLLLTPCLSCCSALSIHCSLLLQHSQNILDNRGLQSADLVLAVICFTFVFVRLCIFCSYVAGTLRLGQCWYVCCSLSRFALLPGCK